jgi:gas vesicle protein
MNNNRILAGLIAGLAAGAVLGILFAPDKGSETRRRVFSSARSFSDRGKSLIDELKEKVRRGEHHHNGNGHGRKSREV